MTERTISEVLNIKTGQISSANAFLDKIPYFVGKERRALEEHIQDGEKYLVCPICFQPLKIRSIQGKYATHFAHLYDSDDCPIKTNQHYTQEEIRNIQYGHVKESERHKHMKDLIVASLSCDPRFSDIRKEPVIRDINELKKRRRPDVFATFSAQTIVFEIQLWTTWLKVLVERDRHYQKNQIFIGWIFDHFEPTELNSLGQDVLSADNNNAFVINETTLYRSQQEHRFFLKCHYQEPVLQQEKIELIWKTQEVCFHDMHLDYQKYKFYYFDFETTYHTLQEQVLLERQKQQEKERVSKIVIQSQMTQELRQPIKLKQESNRVESTVKTPIQKIGKRNECQESLPDWCNPNAVFVCERCGKKTTDWKQLNTATNTCICGECLKQPNKEEM